MVHTEFIFNIETKSSILFLFDFMQNTNQYLQLFLFIIFMNCLLRFMIQDTKDKTFQ